MSLGRPSALLKLCCPSCKPLVLPHEIDDTDPARFGDVQVIAYRKSIEAAVSHWGEDRWLAQVINDFSEGIPTIPSGKIVDKNWVDIEELRAKLRYCFSKHGVKCSWTGQPDSSFRMRPDWLINVNEMYITQGSPDMPYVALSYVWVQFPSLSLSQSNLKFPQVKGALRHHELSPTIPNTIKDSVELVRLLGLRYLWVDCLCIVQDAASKHAVINNMGTIYANAVVTIVAAQGDDADYGLREISQASDPRVVEQKLYEIGSKLQLVELQNG